MALSNCKDCGREVSTRARHCVHCGRPSPSRNCCTPLATLGMIGVIALGAVGAMIFTGGLCRWKERCRIQQMERSSGLRDRELIRCVETEVKTDGERK